MVHFRCWTARNPLVATGLLVALAVSGAPSGPFCEAWVGGTKPTRSAHSLSSAASSPNGIRVSGVPIPTPHHPVNNANLDGTPRSNPKQPLPPVLFRHAAHPKAMAANDALSTILSATKTTAGIATATLSLLLLLLLLPGVSIPAAAAEPPATSSSSRVVGSISGSGLFFKDTLEIEAFDDPKVQGVKLYVSNFQIPLTERLSTKNFFSDPSYASVGCARTGRTVRIADTIAKGPGGEEVFEENKSLLFKALRVQRVYDEPSNTIIYVSFNTRLDKNDDTNKSRFKSSLCVIGLD